MAVLIETRLNTLKLNESVNPRKGCLGRLEGICADFKNPTRNGRLYTRKLWENVFNDPIFKESLESKTLLGELDHPEDRLEVLAGEACIVMTDYRIDEDEGVIYAGFDILDTPRGKILKTLLDYGCVMGVSSRGQGDITTTSSGETVDEDTYDFACFDVVTTPAVEKARQNVVESVGKTKRFVESIRTQIKEAETIGDLNAIRKVVEVTQSSEVGSLLESIQNKCDLIKEGRTTTSDNNESQTQVEPVETEEDTVKSGTEQQVTSAKTIREQKELLSCLNHMRRQISAYKYRESKLLQVIQSKDLQIEHLESEKEQFNSIKYTNSMLKRENRQLKTDNQSKVNKFHESLSTKNRKIDSLKQSVNLQEELVGSLKKDLTESNNSVEMLKNQLNTRNNDIRRLKETLSKNKDRLSSLQSSNDNYRKQLSEQNDTIEQLENSIQELNEQLTSLQNNMDSSLIESDNTSKQMELEINSYSQLVDDLHKQVLDMKSQITESNTTEDKLNTHIRRLKEQLNMYQRNYVNTKSKQLGVDPAMVQKYVNEGTTVTQINKIVEDLQETKDRYAKLPISENAPVGVKLDSTVIKDVDSEEARLETFVEKIVIGQ